MRQSLSALDSIQQDFLSRLSDEGACACVCAGGGLYVDVTRLSGVRPRRLCTRRVVL
jgi:hypothetical protein